MPITDLRQIAESAIETALSALNDGLVKERAIPLLHALEADLAAIPEPDELPILEIDGVQVTSDELIAAYRERRAMVESDEKREAAVEVSEVIRKQGDAIVLMSSDGKKELQRFEFGAGKKHENEKAARAAAHKREGQIKAFKRESEAYIEEIAGSLTDISRMVEEAFHAKFSPADRFEGPYRTRDVFAAHSTMGDAVVVWDRTEGKLFHVPYTTGEDGIEFSGRDEWREVVHTYQFVDVAAEAAECDISESADFNVRAVEIIHEDGAHVLPELGARSPVIIKAQAIEPGLGNKRDMNYYGAEMLRRCGPKVFSGVDVFVTNHKVGEKTDPHKIGRFREVVGFSGTGAPISEVVIYDPAYAEKTRARAAADQLETMEFSIHAKGTARKGVMDGAKCNIVEEITEVQSIDLVGKAGAGGRALGLAESAGGDDMADETKKKKDVEEVAEGARDIAIEEQGDPKPKQEAQPQDEPKPVTVERVKEMLAEAKVPQRFRKWIERGVYGDEAAVTEAIAEAQKDATELTEAGRPFGLGPVDHAAITESRASLAETYAEIEKRHGVVPLAG